MYALDFSFLDFIQSHLRSGFGDAVMPFITHLGDGGAVWITLNLCLLAVPKTRRAGAVLSASLVLEATCCNLLLKPFVARVRPCDINTTIQLLVSRPTDFSFPSGHTGASFAAVSALYFSGSRLWPAALVLAVLIAFSRLYLYVHYPTDVLAGALLGIILGWLGSTAVSAVERKRHEV